MMHSLWSGMNMGNELRKPLITNNMRVLRFHAGEMTQQELADAVKVSRQTINAIEAGKYYPTLELAFRLAAVFGVELGEVFAWQDDTFSAPSRR